MKLNAKYIILSAITFITFASSSNVYADIHPVIFKDDSDLYLKVNFGMGFNDFKSNLSSNIAACQNADQINKFADKACKVGFKTKDMGMNDALVMFKNEKLIAVVYKINNIHYQAVVEGLSTTYREKPQTEIRNEKKGLFSKEVSNEYSIWAFNDYLMVVSKFDVKKYNPNGPNFLYATESTNADTINSIKDEAKNKSKIDILQKVSSVDFNTLHQKSVGENSQNNLNENSAIKNQADKNNSVLDSETRQDAEVFGIPIGRRLQMPECKKQYGIYGLNKKSLCFERLFGKEKLTSSIENETVRINFPISDSPKIVKNGVLLGTIIDGKLEGINFNTFGLRVAEDVLLKLKEKYGEPQEYLTYEVENGLGRKFDAFSALWKLDNLEVYMQSIVSNVTSGLVSIDTPKAKAVKNESLKTLQKDPRPL